MQWLFPLTRWKARLILAAPVVVLIIVWYMA